MPNTTICAPKRCAQLHLVWVTPAKLQGHQSQTDTAELKQRLELGQALTTEGKTLRHWDPMESGLREPGVEHTAGDKSKHVVFLQSDIYQPLSWAILRDALSVGTPWDFAGLTSIALVMINFMCQFDWIRRCSDMWLNMILGYAYEEGLTFELVNWLKNITLSRAGRPHTIHGGSKQNKKVEEGRIHSLCLTAQARHRSLLEFQQFPWFSSLQNQTPIHQQFSWISSL